MTGDPRLIARAATGLESEADFSRWVHRVVTGAAELHAFEAGELDAIMDPVTGSAILSPGARIALRGSEGMALAVLDALPGEACVIDSVGTVVASNRAWRALVDSRAGAGLAVREGANFFAACCDAAAGDRRHAAAVAAGLRQVLVGARQSCRCQYSGAAPDGSGALALTMARFVAAGAVHALVTRESVGRHKRGGRPDVAGTARNPAGRTMSRAPAVSANWMLCALPDIEYERLLGDLEPVNLSYGDVLYQPGEKINQVYFPNDCPISLLTVVEGNRTLEVGLVGPEGMVGSPLALGSATSPVRALVQGSGTALRMSSTQFMKHYRQSPALQQALLGSIEELMNQVTQNAACNHFHEIQQRLARWLLMMRERVPTRSFYLTHDYLADMLGTRRETVTQGAHALKCRGLIKYTRGNLTILNQRGLQATACSCYQRVRIIRPKGRRAGP
jgi:CRP-like cAMP-binding protein